MEKDILPMLDFPFWIFTLSGFNAEQDCAIFIDLRLNANDLWVNRNWTLFASLFPVLSFNMSLLQTI